MHPRSAVSLACLWLIGSLAACGPKAPAAANPQSALDPTAPVAAPSRAEILAGSDLPEPLPTPVPGDAMGVTIHRLSNGLTVYISTDRETPRIATLIAVRAGSRHDPPNSTGLAHYLEHMLFKGTDELGTVNADAELPHLKRIEALYEDLRQQTDERERHKILAEIDAETQASAKYAIPNEFDQLYAKLGITGVNAFTSDEQTIYLANVPANRFTAWARVEAERLRDPVFRLFYPELEAVYEEKNQALDDPQERVFEAMHRALFPQHPYGTQPTIGVIEHLKSPAYRDMAAYFRRWYVPNNVAIVLAGDIDAQTALPILQGHFGDWQPEPLPSLDPAVLPPVAGRQQRDITAEGESAVYLAWQTAGMNHRDQPALEVLDWLMDNETTGLINVDLVLSQTLPRAGSLSRHYIDAGYWAMFGIARAGQSLADVESLLLGTVQKLRAGAFTQADIDAIVLHAQIREMRELESNAARVAKMAAAYVHHIKWPQAARRSERLRQVTRADVIAVAKKYLGNNFVAIRQTNGKYVPPAVRKPKITPVQIDPAKHSQFATAIAAMPAPAIAPEWLIENTHYARQGLSSGDLLTVTNRKNQLFWLLYRFDFGYRQQPLLCFALDLLEQSGTRALSAQDFKRRLNAMGSQIHLRCDADSVWLTVEGIDSNLPASVAQLNAWLRDADLREDTRTRLVQNVISQRRDEMNDPQVLSAALTAFAEHDGDSEYLVAPSDQALSSTNTASLGALLAALANYRHDRVYFGPRSPRDVAKNTALGANHKPAPPRKPVTYRRVNGARIFFLPRKVSQSSISLVIPKAPLPAAERPLSRLYSEYTGNGMGALIAQEIREARGLAYSAWAGHVAGWHPDDQSGVMGFLGTQGDKTVTALNTLLDLIRDLPMQPERLTLAKQSLDEKFRASRFQPRQVPLWLLAWKDLGYAGDPRPAQWQAIRKFGASELRAFAQRFAQGDLIIGITGDASRIDMQALERIAPVQTVAVTQLFSY